MYIRQMQYYILKLISGIYDIEWLDLSYILMCYNYQITSAKKIH